MIKSFISELKRFKNDKVLITVLVIMPVIFNIFICSVLWKEVMTNIPMAIIDYDNSELSNQIVSYFSQNEIFNVKYYPQSYSEMDSLIKESKAKVGMIIPKDFYKDVSTLKSPSIIMIYDGTSMSITSSVKSKATEILLTIKTGASIKQLTARLNIPYETAFNMAQAVQYENRFLYNPYKSYKNFLAPMLIAGLIQTSIALTATSSIREDEYSRERRRRLGHATGKVLFYTFMGIINFVISVLLQKYILKADFKGNIADAALLSAALCFAVSAFCVLVSSLFTNKVVATAAGAVLFIPNSVMAGSTWPCISMPIGYRAFAKFIPFTHFVNNMRNIYLKGIGIDVISNDILYMLIFGAVVLAVSELSVIFLCDSRREDELSESINA